MSEKLRFTPGEFQNPDRPKTREELLKAAKKLTGEINEWAEANGTAE